MHARTDGRTYARGINMVPFFMFPDVVLGLVIGFLVVTSVGGVFVSFTSPGGSITLALGVSMVELPVLPSLGGSVTMASPLPISGDFVVPINGP